MDDKAKPPAVQEVIGPADVIIPSNGGGENRHVPNHGSQAAVKMMVAAGRPQSEIATALKITTVTLRKHYRTELDEGLAEINKLVLGKLFKKINDDDTASILFFCKTRLNMKETMSIDFPNGIPPAGDATAVTENRTKQLILEVLNDL